MAIDIKEIFKSDLDPNSNSWWSQDKVDKINNNFRQLSSGGMSGPMGSQGSFGLSGLLGAKGFQGFQGTLGDQGNDGSIGNTTWIGVEGTLTGSIHIFPEKQNPEYSTTPIVVGFADTDPTAVLFSQQPVHYLSPRSSTLKIHTEQWSAPWSNESVVNLKLTTYVNDRSGDETVDLKDSQHRIFHDSVNLNDIYEEGRLRNGGTGFTRRINLGPNDTYSIRTLVNGIAGDSILISSSGTIFKNNIKISSANAVVDGDLYIQNGAGADKVLISLDEFGVAPVKWVDKQQAFPGYKDGMIISIPDWAFNSTNFDLQTQYQQNSLTQDPIRFTYGRGIVGGQYEGWYLCNGREWNTVAGVNETLVPNLHYTELVIDQNGSQVIVNQTNGASSIMGGHDIEMRATYIGGNKYDVEYNTPFHDNNDDSIMGIKQMIGGTHYVNKMIYLVKLPYNNLEWEESTASVPTLQSIALSYGNTSAASCNSTTANQYRWDAPSGINVSSAWCGFNQSYKLYQQNTLSYAPTGWYKFHNQFTVCSRYWNATTGTFSTSVTCPTWNNITLNYSTRISLLNNNGATSYQLAEMNSTSFSTATEIKAQTTGATLPAGWYGNGDTTNPIKRYWNGTMFQGEILTHKYYGKLVLPNPYRVERAISSSIACSNNTLGLFTLYVGSSSAIQGYTSASAISTGITLYGNLNWSYVLGAISGSAPLVNVANQAAPGATGGSSNRITHVTDYTYVSSVVDNQTTISIDNNGNPAVGTTCP